MNLLQLALTANYPLSFVWRRGASLWMACLEKTISSTTVGFLHQRRSSCRCSNCSRATLASLLNSDLKQLQGVFHRLWHGLHKQTSPSLRRLVNYWYSYCLLTAFRSDFLQEQKKRFTGRRPEEPIITFSQEKCNREQSKRSRRRFLVLMVYLVLWMILGQDQHREKEELTRNEIFYLWNTLQDMVLHWYMYLCCWTLLYCLITSLFTLALLLSYFLLLSYYYEDQTTDCDSCQLLYTLKYASFYMHSRTGRED